MKQLRRISLVLCMFVGWFGIAPGVMAAATTDELVAICEGLYGGVYGVPNGEPLGACQWDKALINASDVGSYSLATGAGVKVGVIDSGVDFSHPDIAPNLDVDLSCSFIFDSTPTAEPGERLHRFRG